MSDYTGTFIFLEGSSYEIGEKQALEFWENPQAKKLYFGESPDSDKAYLEMRAQIEEYCPGLNEELEGFAKGFGLEPNQLNFFNDAWLTPGGCSLGVVSPRKMIDGKTYLVRNYDLSPEISDMRLCSTKVKGRFAHTGFSVSIIGRSEGLNEKGLCVAFASCGMPIGNYPGMREPASSGLQFMVIVRAILETCKNTEEAVYAIKNMPVGTNMNLLIADAEGEAALASTFDGVKLVEKTDMDYLTATNHAVFPEIQNLEQGKLNQSLQRYKILESTFSAKGKRSVREIKELLLKEYPEGVSVHNYNENFGTVHSVLFNLTDRQLDFSFGSPLQNSLYKINVGESFPKSQVPVQCKSESYGMDFWSIVES
ncbi:choloylglycine hydrolase [Virgibacillus sp. NKC19-3]|uniref:C45 family autoproteolytic acyltransferase/hydolase n=1 Tax=Virgibacillus saliphilus TaxID=2831674 RepID=UPI001C9A66EE|nr:C45 family peptidase [Virgibacillus sp. NKC19-3]MBY7141865.1 choloylglycine hydrolase [Virgibacillus sp. NKC19-3]